MRKIFALLFLPLFLASSLFAEPEKEKKIAIGILSGLYFMQDEAFQETYGKSALFLGAEIPFRLFQKSLKNIDCIFHFRYIYNKGKTSLTEEELKLNLIDLSLSLRYLMDSNKFTPFLGLGIDYILYKEKYPETFPIESLNGATLGFHVLGGSYYRFSSSLSAKVYFKYIIAKAVEEEVKVNLGGTEWGLGVVYYF